MRDFNVSGSSVMMNYSFILPLEKDFDPMEKRKWIMEHKHQVYYCAGIYLLLTFGCQFYMKSRSRYDLRYITTAWNVSMAAFSVIGLCRTLPELLFVLNEFGFSYSVCNPSFIAHDKVTALWTWLSLISKFPEFANTLFILFRKHELMFLHLFRHTTAVLFVWFCYSEHLAAARWFVVINFFARSLMYIYYALYVMRFQVHRFFTRSVTTAQIMQAVIGLGVSYFGYIAGPNPQYCKYPKYLAVYGMSMYGIVLVLFAWYFYRQYEIRTMNQLVKDRAMLSRKDKKSE